MSRAVLVAPVGRATGSEALAAALAGEVARGSRTGLLVALGSERVRRPSVFAAAPARAMEEELAAVLADAGVAARGATCQVALQPDGEDLERLAIHLAGRHDSPLCVVHAPGEHFRTALERGPAPVGAALLRADLETDRALTALAVRPLIAAGLPVRIAKCPLGWLGSRRALAGLPAGTTDGVFGRLLARVLGDAGQALPLVLGGIAVLMIAVLALVSIAGALTGKGRAQRTADLAALSAARSMRDDLPRLLSPPVLPGGLPNPRHLGKGAYLERAGRAAVEAAVANGVSSSRVGVEFPDRGSFAPVRARVVVVGEFEANRKKAPVAASAVAEAAAPGSAARPSAQATGGGYSGPLLYRQGEGMRPDVAAAFDAMAADASGDGLALVVTSGFRSDAEQAQLFAANPDPRWVAPPGQSLHRCATELDLGPPSAYGWLAANASRFGFVKRYSWEPWHFGFDGGPPPCSAAGDAVGGSGADGGAAGGGGLPAFVPAPYRAPLLRSAARWNVSAALLAAQLMAESNFNPFAVSPAGAQGIAQFMPATAIAYGLRDPFDPGAAIDAQAHLMSDLLRRFGSPALALAAYNAGPGPVAACGCVPPIPETTAYVARILALLDGAGALLSPPFEVRLIE